MTISELTEWLVLNGWPRVDMVGEGEDAFADPNRDPHWIYADDLSPPTVFIIPDGTRPYWLSIAFQSDGQHRDFAVGDCRSARILMKWEGDWPPSALNPILGRINQLDL